jgi:hypothetical protein
MHANQGHNASTHLIGEAIESGTVYEVFIGLKNKSYSQHASLPTDDEYVFNSWVAFLNSQSEPHDRFWALYKDTIFRISKHDELSWLSVYYLYAWLNYSQRKNHYPAEMQTIISTIIKNVSHFKDQLNQDYRWTGYEKANFSIWADVLRMLSILQRSHPFSFQVES